MTEKEAMSQGLSYTGMSWSRWNDKDKALYKQRADEYKKKYKVRLVVVNSKGTSYQSYYGDRNFCRIQYNTIEQCTERLARLPAARQALQEEYRKKLAELDAKEVDLTERLAFAKSLLK